jgi:hypothetical protein
MSIIKTSSDPASQWSCPAWACRLKVHESVEHLLQYTKTLLPIMEIPKMSKVVKMVPAPPIFMLPESQVVDFFHIITIVYLILGPFIFAPKYYPWLLALSVCALYIWSSRLFGKYRCPLAGLSQELVEKEQRTGYFKIWNLVENQLSETLNITVTDALKIIRFVMGTVLLFNCVYMTRSLLRKYKIKFFVDAHTSLVSWVALFVLVYAFYVIHFDTAI